MVNEVMQGCYTVKMCKSMLDGNRCQIFDNRMITIVSTYLLNT